MKKFSTSIEISSRDSKLELISVSLIPVRKELKPPRVVEFIRNVSELKLLKKD